MNKIKEAWLSGILTISMLVCGIIFMTSGWFWFGFATAILIGFYFMRFLWMLTELNILPFKK